jgi:uncharacterized protein YecE (DUF72 family)
VTPSLRIGTSGWNYPNGRGTWNGIFYPPSRKRPKGFDELSFYASHFNTVEVNSTFYGQPRAEVSRGWAERTPAGFEFSVKLYQKFTHPKMYEERLASSLVPDEADGEASVAARDWLEEVATPNQADLDEFRRGIDPLVSAGKLGAVLAQFPPSFKDTPAARAYLSSLLGSLGGYRVAIELRHRSWSDHIGDTLDLLNEFQAAWVQIDEPKFKFSIRQNYLPNVRGFYYMRLHGRNAAQWWKHAKSEDRYDYLYSADELREFSETANAARRLVRNLYLYTNNHFSAKSVANAAMIKHQIGEPNEGQYPPEFIERYPETAGTIQVAGRDGAWLFQSASTRGPSSG